MKVIIDRPACIGCGSCRDTCRGFFEQNHVDSFSQIIEKFTLNGDIAQGMPPEDLNDCARDAADRCLIGVEEI